MIGTHAFMSPEIFNSLEYSKAGDVYAYSILLYQLFTLENPFEGITNILSFMRSVIDVNRPDFKFHVHECYKKLFEKCWENDPNKRPAFDEIVDILEGEEFITDDIGEEEYLDYISFIEKTFQ